MKSPSKPVVCTLVFFFLILVVTGQTELKTRAEKPTVDDTVKVNGAPPVRAPGIKGCFQSKVSSFTVRFQSLKTSDGSVYTRQLVTTADLPCFEKLSSNATLDATNIADCAEATAMNGMNSFSWENGVCTAYLAWRPQKRADCKDGGSKVVYVVKTPLTPFEGGNKIASAEINYDALPRVFVDIIEQDDFCGFSSRRGGGSKLQINGSDAVTLPEGQTTYNLSIKIKCSASVEISFWSVGADGSVNSDEIKLTYTGGARSRYYRLFTGGCFYDADRQADYLGSLQYCNSNDNGTLYFEQVTKGAFKFLKEMSSASVFDYLDGAYVGLTWAPETNFTWFGGRPQANYDGYVWYYLPEGGTWACATIYLNDGWYLYPRTDCTRQKPVLCYYPNP